MSPPRSLYAVIVLLCAVTLAACSSDRSAPAPMSTHPVRFTYGVPQDITPLVLPATGAETRWSQGLDAFAQSIGEATSRACARSHGTALPDHPPPAYIRRAELPDLEFIRQHGFGAVPVALPGPSPADASTGVSPAGQRCLRQGAEAMRGFRDLYATTQSAWMTEVAGLRAVPAVREAFRGLGPCLAARGIEAADEEGLFAVADRRLAADRTDADLAVAYTACMAPVEAIRSPLREQLRRRFLATHSAQLRELNRALPARIGQLQAHHGIWLSFPVP
ncbi:hypothetical protein [Streptomyces sp. CBMA152]|uniref:hypothetical protein n=1 Tax=Streptomyces sp. CBMA152 TaxID=1896312 RepID=UPI0016616BB2|nr:hypothetical protein [Streptomyces sp. CBMA152]MBD0741408.1 hypothetical protein [Streptomyces sp. CBMA152]